MSALDAFVCDRCKEQVLGRPVAYWTTTPWFEHAVGLGHKSMELCRACTDEIQQAIGTSPRLPRAERRGLLARLLGGPG